MPLSRLEMVLWSLALGLAVAMIIILYKRRRVILEGFQIAGGAGNIQNIIQPVDGQPGLYMDLSGNTFQGPVGTAVEMTAEGPLITTSYGKLLLTPEGPILNSQPDLYTYAGPSGSEEARLGCEGFISTYKSNKVLYELNSKPLENLTEEEKQIYNTLNIRLDKSDPRFEENLNKYRIVMTNAKDNFDAINCSNWGFTFPSTV